jgi:hypothetical protein
MWGTRLAAVTVARLVLMKERGRRRVGCIDVGPCLGHGHGRHRQSIRAWRRHSRELGDQEQADQQTGKPG